VNEEEAAKRVYGAGTQRLSTPSTRTGKEHGGSDEDGTRKDARDLDGIYLHPCLSRQRCDELALERRRQIRGVTVNEEHGQ